MPHDFGHRTLTDTGSIVAMIDSNDKNYDHCWEAMRALPAVGIVTPIACLVEILYLLEKAGGRPLQRKLWSMIDDGILRLRPETAADCVLAFSLMDKYADIPMDFADGIVVVSADVMQVDTVFTIDKHFYAYRKSNGSPFRVVPG